MRAKPVHPRTSQGLMMLWHRARREVAPLAPLRRDLAQGPKVRAMVRWFRLARREIARA